MLHQTAYAAEESLLLTFEDARLFAFDAFSGAPIWQLELPAPIAGIVFVSPNALGPGPAASPWRSGMSGSTAAVVDGEGRLHLVDASGVGRLVHSTEPVGAPTAIASGVDAVAVATSDAVHVWRDGTKRELAFNGVTALGFSSDGTLAIGTKKGTLTTDENPPRALVTRDVAIRSLAWSVRTGWLAGTDQGLFLVERDQKLLDGRVRALAVDTSTFRIAVPRGDQMVLVYDWPIRARPAHSKITVKRRAIEDLAFGPNGQLAVGTNRGDAAIVDLVGQTGKMVARHAGRPVMAWKLEVGRVPPPAPAQAPTSMTKVGFGGLSLLAITARLIFMVARTSSSSSGWTPPPDYSKELRCDENCAKSRLVELRSECEKAPAIDCNADAEAAQASFAVGDCAAAKRSITEVQSKTATAGSEGTTGVMLAAMMAQLGMSACKESARDGLFTLIGEELEPQHVDVPFSAGAEPFAVYASPSGQTFVSAVDHVQQRCELWRSVGLSWQLDTTSGECTSAQVFGRGENAYVAFGQTVKHFSNSGWEDLHWQGDMTLQITGAPELDSDLFVTTAQNELARYHLGTWTTEKLPQSNVVLGAMTFADNDLLLDTVDRKSGGYALLRRGRQGAWSTTRSSFGIDPLYGHPSGLVVAARSNEIDVSTDKGLTWSVHVDGPTHVNAFWARSATEIYAGGSHGLARWDGESWQTTAFRLPIGALSGNMGQLYAIVQHQP